MKVAEYPQSPSIPSCDQCIGCNNSGPTMNSGQAQTVQDPQNKSKKKKTRYIYIYKYKYNIILYFLKISNTHLIKTGTFKQLPVKIPMSFPVLGKPPFSQPTWVPLYKLVTWVPRKHNKDDHQGSHSSGRTWISGTPMPRVMITQLGNSQYPAIRG